MQTNIFTRIKNAIEKVIPMTFGSLILFLAVIYLLVIVGRAVWINYQSGKGIEEQVQKIADLQDEVRYLEFQVAYYQTDSFKEKEARAKLGYKAPGENVISLPTDAPADKVADSVQTQEVIEESNPRLWWKHFFGS